MMMWEGKMGEKSPKPEEVVLNIINDVILKAQEDLNVLYYNYLIGRAEGMIEKARESGNLKLVEIGEEYLRRIRKMYKQYLKDRRNNFWQGTDRTDQKEINLLTHDDNFEQNVLEFQNLLENWNEK